MNSARTFIPNKMVLIRPKDNPWYTAELRRLRRRRDRLFKRMKDIGTPEAWDSFKLVRNSYVQELKNAKMQYEQRQINKINISGSTRSWWQTVKGFFHIKNKSVSIPALSLSDGSVTNDPVKKANAFNAFFIGNSKQN